jgi:hypothetical protein
VGSGESPEQGGWLSYRMTEPKYSKEEINQLQDELLSLVEAWVDRGIPPGDSAFMIAGLSHMLIKKFTDMTFEDLMEIAKEQWDLHD